MVLPRENPRPDRRPGENLRCGERTRARRKGTELGGRGQASRPAIRHAQFRGAAPYPVVDASFVSFTPPPTAGFTRDTASPLQIKPTVLGLRLAETKDGRRYKL